MVAAKAVKTIKRSQVAIQVAIQIQAFRWLSYITSKCAVLKGSYIPSKCAVLKGRRVTLHVFVLCSISCV